MIVAVRVVIGLLRLGLIPQVGLMARAGGP